MSLIASRWAWEQQLESAAKLMLLALADHADDQGRCWPSVGRLAARTGLHLRTVQRKITEVEEAGLIKRSTAPGGVSTYLLQCPLPMTPAGSEGNALDTYPRHGAAPGTVSPLAHGHPTPDTVPPRPGHSAGGGAAHGHPTPGTMSPLPGHSATPTPGSVPPHPGQSAGGGAAQSHPTPGTVPGELKEEEKEVRTSLRSDHVRDPDKSGSTRSDATAAKPRRAPTQAIEPAGFSEFWLAYPNKVARPKALQAYARAVKRGAIPAEMLAGLRRFQFPEDVQFTPHPATWLNNDRWQDAAVRTPPSPQRQPGKSYAGCM